MTYLRASLRSDKENAFNNSAADIFILLKVLIKCLKNDNSSEWMELHAASIAKICAHLCDDFHLEQVYRCCKSSLEQTALLYHSRHRLCFCSSHIISPKLHEDICLTMYSSFFILWASTGVNSGESHFLLQWVQIPRTTHSNLIPLEDSI